MVRLKPLSGPLHQFFENMKKSLQIHINSIADTGREVGLSFGKEWFARWREEDSGLEFSRGAIDGTVRLEKHGRDVLVRGHLAGRLDLACSRCLEEFSFPVQADFDLLLAPEKEPMSGEDEELTAADLDLDFYTGEVVDLESIIREQIILTLPLKPLCFEDCRGLCTRCGANLNQERCACKAETAAGPLAGLAKLKI